MDVHTCLRDNDTLWIRLVTSELKWVNVSLYKNDFFDVASITAFVKEIKKLELSTTSPEFTEEGSFPKCWIKDGNNIYLIKRGSEGFANAELEPYSEFYVSNLAKKICKKAVDYHLVQYKNHIATKCSLFTNEQVGFVPMGRFFIPNREPDLQDVLEFCRSKGYKDEFRRMIVLDSIIINQDRHLGNFGF